jgi:CubicO group peptidase (beta-lactamase class C family)
MKHLRLSHTTAVLGFCLALSLPDVAQSGNRRKAPDATTVSPESVGFSSERLENLHRLVQDEIDQKELAGAITILARHGKIVDYRVYGERDIDSHTPMTKDTIFRDYSMSKPVTGVAMMILFDQGKCYRTIPSRSTFLSSRTSKYSTGLIKRASRS